jgi:hypothetical protein
MDVTIKYTQSAFKHGVTEADIRHAVMNLLYDDMFDDDLNKHLLLGFDSNANLLEILYNVVDGQMVRVFHAMPCRTAFIALLNQ